jgi:hypothetical protein
MCEQELVPVKNGVYVFEMADFGIYKIWHADKYECTKCGASIVTGFANEPTFEHFEDGFNDFVIKLMASPDNTIVYNYGRNGKYRSIGK